MAFQKSVNPTTGAPGLAHTRTPPDDVVRILEQADVASKTWRTTSFADRAQVLGHVAALLDDRADALARLMADEMGKPLVQGAAEARKCALVCRFYAEHAEAFLAPEVVETDARSSTVHFTALGALLAIMPWNFPFWQVFRFAAPALMAGNAVLLKHAPNVFGCAKAIESLFGEAGLPDGLFQNLFVGVGEVAGIIASPRVQAVSFTGSTRGGRAVAVAAGAALKKTVLELGGSDPYVVLADADLDVAVDACVTGRMLNTGQSCIAAKRWIVVDDVREQFEQRVLERLRAQTMGDPLDERSDIGPMAREDLRDELHRQIAESVEAGARLLLGGTVPDRPGWWYPPTLLTDVAPGMPAWSEELFGPAASIVPVRNEADAIDAANDTSFGLGAAVFTQDVERGARIAADALEAGSCFVNAMVHSDPRLPFGGIKDSGYGRELGVYGIRELVNVKTVFVA